MSEVLSPIPPSSQPSNVTNIASVSSTGATALTRHDHIAIELSATAGHANADNDNDNDNGNGRAMTPTRDASIDHPRFPSLHTPIATRTSSATTAATFVNVRNGGTSNASSTTNGTSREVKEEKLSIRVIGSSTATATAASPSSSGSGSASASTGATLIATPPNIPINVSLPATGSKIWLVEHDGTRHQWVSGQTEDAFSLDSLDDMIRRRWAAGKSCIIAAVPTRDKEKVGFSTTSYYDAFAANRLLFKKIPIGNGLLADVVHRYHRSHPISVLNPLTNSPIIGEVKYYSVDPRASLINGNGHSNGMNDISLVDVDARFIGTDYNFAFSNDVRKRFADAAFEPEDQLVVDLAAALQNPVERRPDAPLNGGIGGAGAAGGGGGMMVDGGFLIINGGQLDMMAPANANVNGEGIGAAFPFAAIPIIDVPYARALMFGVMIAFYFLVAFLIVQKAVVSLMDGSNTPDPQGWYWSFLPFFSFAVDRLIATMHRVREGRRHMAMKFFIWIAYFLFPTVVFARDSSQYSVSRDARDVAFPLAMIAYSIGYYIILGLRHKLV